MEKKLCEHAHALDRMGCGDSKGADASVELADDVDPLVIEEALKQAAEAVQAAASAAEAAQAGAQRAAEAARNAAAAAALVAEAAGPAAAAAATKAFQVAHPAQDGRQQVVMPPMIMPPRAWSPSPRDELSPRVRRSSTPNQESFGHRTHDEEVAEFEDEPDTPDESEAEASDVEFSERVPLTPSTPLNPPARNGGFKPRGPSPLAVSAAAVPPVPIRDQVQRALLAHAHTHTRTHTFTHTLTRARARTYTRTHTRAHIHAHLKSPVARAAPAPLRPCTAARLRPRCAGPVCSAGRDLGGRAPIHCRAGGGHGGAAREDAPGGAAHSLLGLQARLLPLLPGKLRVVTSS